MSGAGDCLHIKYPFSRSKNARERETSNRHSLSNMTTEMFLRDKLEESSLWSERGLIRTFVSSPVFYVVTTQTSNSISLKTNGI